MHGADCPSCGTHIELDFKPVSGVVWCPKCQKLFSPAAASGENPVPNAEQDEVIEERNGEPDDNS
jgi:uncharacterized Zn finger protein (UPF0148 family)